MTFHRNIRRTFGIPISSCVYFFLLGSNTFGDDADLGSQFRGELFVVADKSYSLADLLGETTASFVKSFRQQCQGLSEEELKGYLSEKKIQELFARKKASREDLENAIWEESCRRLIVRSLDLLVRAEIVKRIIAEQKVAVGQIFDLEEVRLAVRSEQRFFNLCFERIGRKDPFDRKKAFEAVSRSLPYKWNESTFFYMY